MYLLGTHESVTAAWVCLAKLESRPHSCESSSVACVDLSGLQCSAGIIDSPFGLFLPDWPEDRQSTTHEMHGDHATQRLGDCQADGPVERSWHFDSWSLVETALRERTNDEQSEFSFEEMGQSNLTSQL